MLLPAVAVDGYQTVFSLCFTYWKTLLNMLIRLHAGAFFSSAPGLTMPAFPARH